VIDAHPEDIQRVDYVRPNGERVMRTIADYRQLNDALFHAGLDSGSRFEWIDTPNRLHFYVIDLERDERGIRIYTLGVRSLDGAGPYARGVALDAPSDASASGPDAPVTFTLRNTGAAVRTDPALHPQDANAWLAGDIYRVTVSVEGEGWSARLVNELSAAGAGEARPVRVLVSPGSARNALLTLRATSESDPSTSATATVRVRR